MQPSSLVFLVIIAVWAAYFVQYWVRRREHLATARSVDQFSESMRVLERRSPLPASNLSTPQPRSYAVTPARVARPQVLVKRAATSPTTATAPTAPPVEHGASAPRALPTARRARAAIMLGALATVVVVGALVALSLVPLYAVAVPVAAVGGALAWSRADAQAQRRARMAARQASRRANQPRPAAEPRTAERRTAEPVPHTAPAAPTGTAPVAAEAEIADEPTSAPVPVRGELYDVQAVETSLRQPSTASTAEPVAAAPAVPARPLVDDDDIPLTWDPVPVPRPTYTMKARVTRPAPTSADLVGDADTEYAAYDEAPERRVAGA
ncbi:hypothetical protein [Pedococcus sp. P5_B7]